MSAVSIAENDAPDRAVSLLPKGRMYLFDTGALYTGTSRIRRKKGPHGVSIVLTVNRGAFELAGPHLSSQMHAAVAIKPLVEHSIYSPAIALAAVLVAPNHPHFRAFRALPAWGAMGLVRESFARFDGALAAAHAGRLHTDSAHRLFHHIIDAVAASLPPAPSLDPRVERIVNLLHENLDLSLEELAESIHLSYHRLSHLFSDSLGLPLRSYRTWQRMHKAFELLARGYKQADVVRLVGFTDVSHFSRACRGACGVSPSAFFSRRIEIISSR